MQRTIRLRLAIALKSLKCLPMLTVVVPDEPFLTRNPLAH
jgi:hypothetical protein